MFEIGSAVQHLHTMTIAHRGKRVYFNFLLAHFFKLINSKRLEARKLAIIIE